MTTFSEQIEKAEAASEDGWMNDRNAELVDFYLGIQRGNMKESSFDTRRSNIRRFTYFLQHTSTVPDYIDEVTGKPTIIQFVSDLREDLSDTTVGTAVSGINSFYGALLEMERVDTHPTDGWTIHDSDAIENLDPNTPRQTRFIESRKEDDTDHDNNKVAIPPEYVEQMLEHPGSPTLLKTLVIRLLWETGIRCGELARVTVNDVDRGQRTIHLQTLKTDPGDSNRTRRVRYSEETEDLLTEWIDFGRREGMCSKPLDDDDGLLVTSQSTQIRPTWASRIIKNSAKRAGLNEIMYVDGGEKNRWMITGHTMRHSHITHHVNELDTPLHHVAQLAGHKSLDTTRSYVSDDWDATLEHADNFHN